MRVRTAVGAILLAGLLAACGVYQAPFSAPVPPQVMTQECGGVRVQLTVERQPHSALMYEVYVTDLSGQFLTDVTRVVLTFTSTDNNASMTIATQPTADGRYASLSGVTIMPGPWRIETIVRRANAPEIACMFSLQL